jgi:DNA-binding IscR family transcriptional regulator
MSEQVTEIFNSKLNGQHKQALNQLNEFLESYSIADFIDEARNQEKEETEILDILRKVIL